MFPAFSISEQTPEQISVKLFQATEEPSTCDLPKNVSWPEIMIHYYSNRELRSSWKKKKKQAWLETGEYNFTVRRPFCKRRFFNFRQNCMRQVCFKSTFLIINVLASLLMISLLL